MERNATLSATDGDDDKKLDEHVENRIHDLTVNL